jgi:putative transposase
MFGALIRAAERWRGLRFTEFELRQIAAVRKDLDAEYDAKLTPPGRSSHPRFSSKISALTRSHCPQCPRHWRCMEYIYSVPAFP